MSTTPSVQLDVFNMALGYAGVAPVTSTSGTDTPTNVCNQYWNAAVRETQRSARWDFCTVLITLAQNTTYSIINNWGYAYTYPATSQSQPECLKIWGIFSPITSAQIVGTFPGIYPNTSISSWSGFNMCSQKYKVVYDSVGLIKVILTNSSQAIAEYSTPVFDTTLWDSSFVQSLSLKLASLICTSLVNDDTKTANLIKLSAESISEAQRINDEEGDGDHNNETSSFLEARGGGGPVSPQFWNSPSTSQY